MPTLVPIGRFAQRTGLTIKALRLYDKLGLLRPAMVDFASGFRYYSPDQVADAERIRLLRSLEMPLEDIRAMLSTSDPEIMRGHLTRHRERIEAHIARSRRALSLLEALDNQWATRRTERDDSGAQGEQTLLLFFLRQGQCGGATIDCRTRRRVHLRRVRGQMQ